MVTVSANYNTIWSGEHWAETKIVVGATTYQAEIMSLNRTQTLFADYYDIGKASMNMVSFVLHGVTAAALPTKTRIEVWTRLTDGANTPAYTNWLPMGVYYTTKPDEDTVGEYLSVTAYDEMWKTGVIPFEQGATFTAWDNPTLRQVAVHLTSGTTVADVIDTNFAGISLALEDATQVTDQIVMPSIPFNYSVREILCDIAKACCGNWIVVFSDDGNGNQVAKLRLVKMADIVSSASKQTIGDDTQFFVKGDDIPSTTEVKVFYGYDESGVPLYAGAMAMLNNGRLYETELKTITSGVEASAVALNILTGLTTSLPPYTANAAVLNPALELGDKVTVGGITSVLGAISTTFSVAMWADIHSPGLEPQDEFPELSSTAQAERRQEINNAVNKAQITINSDSITAEVERATAAEEDLNTNIRSTLTQTADSIRAEITEVQTDLDGHAQEQAKYIQYGVDGLELGADGSQAKAKLTNTKLSFTSPEGDEKAYIGEDSTDNVYKFFVVNGHIVNQLELGEKWMLIASGSENDYRLTFKARG